MSEETSVSYGTSTGPDGGSTGERRVERHATVAQEHEWSEMLEYALRLPAPPSGFWYRVGLSPRAERRMEIGFGVLLYALAVGWVWTLSHLRTSLAAGEVESAPSAAVRAAATVASALTNTNAPSAAYLTDMALNALVESARGLSGKLRVVIDTSGKGIEPDTLPPGAELRYGENGEVTPADTQPKKPGVWSVAVAIGNAIRPVADLSLITTEPFSAKSNGRIGLYYLGNWPAERKRGKVGPSRAAPAAYANPSGFIQVTPQNEDTYVSEHFRLRDFLTHDQPNVWPKYVVLQLKLVDKLELVLEDLAAHGVDISGVKVMSGFRTPRYNATGGNPQGRAALSRQMDGDAADV